MESKKQVETLSFKSEIAGLPAWELDSGWEMTSSASKTSLTENDKNCVSVKNEFCLHENSVFGLKHKPVLAWEREARSKEEKGKTSHEHFQTTTPTPPKLSKQW